MFYLKADGHEEFDKWLSSLARAIMESRGFREEIGIDEKAFKVKSWRVL